MSRENLHQIQKDSKYKIFYWGLLSPRILLHSCMSFLVMVTLFAWIAAKFVSSKRLTMYASVIS